MSPMKSVFGTFSVTVTFVPMKYRDEPVRKLETEKPESVVVTLSSVSRGV
jgi:hypothetical protein